MENAWLEKRQDRAKCRGLGAPVLSFTRGLAIRSVIFQSCVFSRRESTDKRAAPSKSRQWAQLRRTDGRSKCTAELRRAPRGVGQRATQRAE